MSKIQVEKELADLKTSVRKLHDKEEHLDHLTTESIEKLREVSKINQDLQDQVKLLYDISMAVNTKNDQLR
ncbi:MAG: hypothetical protein KGI33_12840, partial [Thaumarchaeota archaeon]|nr:hypothetical protein [Nitrososphaerota archaeon]